MNQAISYSGFGLDEIEHASFGLEALASDLRSQLTDINISVRKLTALEESIKPVVSVTAALESIDVVSINAASVVIDTIDIGLARTGLGVEDISTDVVGYVGSKAPQNASKGVLRTIMDSILAMIKAIWETVQNAWDKLTNLYGHAESLIDRLEEKVKALRAASATAPEKCNAGRLMTLFSDRYDDEGLIPVSGYADVEATIKNFLRTSESLSGKFLPSLIAVGNDLREVTSNVARRPGDVSTDEISALIKKAMSITDLQALSTSLAQKAGGNVPGLNMENDEQAFYSPIGPGGQLLAVIIPEAGGDDNPLGRIKTRAMMLPFSKKQRPPTEVPVFSLQEISSLNALLKSLTQHAKLRGRLARDNQVSTIASHLHKEIMKLEELTGDASRPIITSLQDGLNLFRRVVQATFATHQYLANSYFYGITNGIALSKVMVTEYK